MNYLKESGSFSRFLITIILLTISVIAVWLTVRVSGLFIVRYLSETDHIYDQYDVLEMISYALTANLCFNLVKNLRIKAEIKNYASAAIQALLIGVIVFLPRSSSTEFLALLDSNFNGVIGFFIVAASIALIFVALVILWKRIEKIEN